MNITPISNIEYDAAKVPIRHRSTTVDMTVGDGNDSRKMLGRIRRNATVYMKKLAISRLA